MMTMRELDLTAFNWLKRKFDEAEQGEKLDVKSLRPGDVLWLMGGKDIYLNQTGETRRNWTVYRQKPMLDHRQRKLVGERPQTFWQGACTAWMDGIDEGLRQDMDNHFLAMSITYMGMTAQNSIIMKQRRETLVYEDAATRRRQQTNATTRRARLRARNRLCDHEHVYRRRGDCLSFAQRCASAFVSFNKGYRTRL
jgi:hypothetical protein